MKTILAKLKSLASLSYCMTREHTIVCTV